MGGGMMKTLSLTYPQKQKSNGVWKGTTLLVHFCQSISLTNGSSEIVKESFYMPPHASKSP